MSRTAAIFSLAVFLSAPVVEVSDSRYTALLSESLWRHGTPELDEYYKVPVPRPTRDPKRPGEANEYQLVVARGHVTYFFPHGTSILSIPLVAAINATGVSAAKPDGHLNLDGEIRIGRWVSSVLMARSRSSRMTGHKPSTRLDRWRARTRDQPRK